MGWLASNRRVIAVAGPYVLHDAALAPPNHDGAVGEVARLGGAADTATIPGRFPPLRTRGEFSRFVLRTMSSSSHSSTVTMAPWSGQLGTGESS